MRHLAKSLTLIFLLSLLCTSCKKKIESFSKDYKFDFAESMQEWNILFSDYPVNEESFYELVFEHTALPFPLDNTIKSLKVSGNNHSDDLMSIIYRKIDGLEANSTYSLTLNVEFASNACINCPGAGGSPDLGISAGAISKKPENEIRDVGMIPYYRPNFSFASLKHLGTIGVGNGLDIPYTLITRNNNGDPVYATTNNNGQLWVLVGTNSGFEGITTLFYRQITMTIKK